MISGNPRNKRRIAVETSAMQHKKELEDAFVMGFMYSGEGFNGEMFRDAGTPTDGLRLKYWELRNG